MATGRGRARDFEGSSSVISPTTCVQLQDMVRLNGRKQHVKCKRPEPTSPSSLVVSDGVGAPESGYGSGSCGPTPRDRRIVVAEDKITEESVSSGPNPRRFLMEEWL